MIQIQRTLPRRRITFATLAAAAFATALTQAILADVAEGDEFTDSGRLQPKPTRTPRGEITTQGEFTDAG